MTRPTRADRKFATTHWSVVLAAAGGSDAAKAAMEKLCLGYWSPLYAFLRREGRSPHDAEDLTQAFIARVLEKNYLGQVDPQKGKFRSFLLASLKHFLADERDRANAAKRGGGQVHVSLDAVSAEHGYQAELADERSPEVLFERRWALTLLATVRARLREEYAAAGKAQRFAVLERFLPGEKTAVTYAEAAQSLGVAEGTVKYDVHVLKQRYRELLVAEISRTVSAPEEVEEELRYLIAVVSS
jgi:RNA polymerase sigma-70 factor (ECF subfamily)